MSDPKTILPIIRENIHIHEAFLDAVKSVLRLCPSLRTKPPIIHTLKSRMKDEDGIVDKLLRKQADGVDVTEGNVFHQITDLAGVRVVHLHLAQFPLIHDCIHNQVVNGDWVLFEDPKAYTWDPESKAFFEGLGLKVHVKESFYTSIHYVVKPRKDSIATCEIQVRTLFEEIWGEIDHAINYPKPTTNTSCREQIRVLARLVGAGSRLADSIFKTHREGLK